MVIGLFEDNFIFSLLEETGHTASFKNDCVDNVVFDYIFYILLTKGITYSQSELFSIMDIDNTL